MAGEWGTALSELEGAVRKFRSRDERRVDLKELRGVIDELEGEFSTEARDAQRAGDHLLGGNITAASWISRTCGMSVTSAADRLCVGEQLQSLPKIAAAFTSVEIAYQSASFLCPMRAQLCETLHLFEARQI